MKPLIAIGDIHGLDYWKKITEKHNGCLILFLGDYLDPYIPMPGHMLLNNLQAILTLKKKHMQDVILLLGNHDVHYFHPSAPRASLYDKGLAKEAYRLFTDNTHLFQYAYQRERLICTHAGISQLWFTEDFKGDLTRTIDRQLNHPQLRQESSLFRVGRARGGNPGHTGGIFWADQSELTDPLHGFMQIVGHNRVANITMQTGPQENNILFCDSLFNGNYLYWDTDASLPSVLSVFK